MFVKADPPAYTALLSSGGPIWRKSTFKWRTRLTKTHMHTLPYSQVEDPSDENPPACTALLSSWGPVWWRPTCTHCLALKWRTRLTKTHNNIPWVTAQAVRWPGIPKVACLHLSRSGKSYDLWPAFARCNTWSSLGATLCIVRSNEQSITTNRLCRHCL